MFRNPYKIASTVHVFKRLQCVKLLPDINLGLWDFCHNLSGISFIVNQTSEILRYKIQNRIEYFSGPGQYINTRF